MKQNIIRLINKVRFLMFKACYNSLFSEKEFNDFNDIIQHGIEANKADISKKIVTFINKNFLLAFKEDLLDLCGDDSKIDGSIPAVVFLAGYEERINIALNRIEVILHSYEQGTSSSSQEEINPKVILELEIYKQALTQAKFSDLANEFFSKEYILFILNRLDGVETWLEAITNNQIPDISIAAIPDFENLTFYLKNVAVIFNAAPVSDTIPFQCDYEEEIFVSPEEVGCVSGFLYTCITFLYNRIFVKEEHVAVRPGINLELNGELFSNNLEGPNSMISSLSDNL
jgi:hypothetical protein